MFLAIAKLLWAFEFQPGDADEPNDSDPVTGYQHGVSAGGAESDHSTDD